MTARIPNGKPAQLKSWILRYLISHTIFIGQRITINESPDVIDEELRTVRYTYLYGALSEFPFDRQMNSDDARLREQSSATLADAKRGEIAEYFDQL